MPLVTAVKRHQTNRDIVTSFIDVAYTTEQTFTFPDTNNRLEIQNSSAGTLTLTVNSIVYTILPFKSQLITDSYTSFTISSTINSAAFECTSIIDNEDDAGSEVDSIKEQLNDIVPRSYPNVFNADVGLRRWRASLENIQTGTNTVINVSVMNNSIGEGTGSSAFLTKGWLPLVKSAFANRFGDVGFGTIPVHFPFGHDTPLWNFTGTWSLLSNYGFAGEGKMCTADGATATIQFSGTGVKILTTSSSMTGQFGATIDGGTEQIIDTSLNTGDCFGYDITGLTEGTHTLVIRKIGTKAIFLLGICPLRGNKGVRFNMTGKSGTGVTSSVLKSDYVTTNGQSLYAEIDYWNPKLTIIEFLANDMSLDIAAYKTRMQIAIDRAKNFGDVLLLPTGMRDNTTYPMQPDFIKTLRDLATQNNIAMIDMFDRWGGNFNYANTVLGYLADTVHPTDKGHQNIANVVLKTLIEF